MTSESMDLLEWAEIQRGSAEHNSIRAAFEAFHALHPEVFVMFEAFTIEGISAGMAKLGAGAVWERMRWETAVGFARSEREGGSALRYRLNNNFRAYYARMFMEQHPEFPGIFETRRVKS